MTSDELWESIKTIIAILRIVPRPLTEKEMQLICFIVSKNGIEFPVTWKFVATPFGLHCVELHLLLYYMHECGIIEINRLELKPEWGKNPMDLTFLKEVDKKLRVLILFLTLCHSDGLETLGSLFFLHEDCGYEGRWLKNKLHNFRSYLSPYFESANFFFKKIKRGEYII